MPTYRTEPILNWSLSELADLFTRAFAGYLVPVHLDALVLATLFRRDAIDQVTSRILLADDGQAIGMGLVARRGWSSRLAAMGVVEAWRGRGAGRFLTGELLREASERGDRRLVLEVFEQNPKALNLYLRLGFRKVRQLVGLAVDRASTDGQQPLTEVDIREVAMVVAQHGLPDLPWQLSAETLATLTPPARAYRLDGACAVITDPAAEVISFRALVVEPGARRRGAATALVRAILAQHAGHSWQVPAIFPEEAVGPLEKAGFSRTPLFQWQMALDLPVPDTK